MMIEKRFYSLSTVMVPRCDEPEATTRKLARLNAVVDAFECMDEMFEMYLENRYSKNVELDLKKWVDSLGADVQ